MSRVTLQAKNDFLILEQYHKDTGDLILPAGEVSEYKYRVLSVGPNVDQAKVGDLIVSFVEPPIKLDSVSYWFTKNDSVLAVVNEEETVEDAEETSNRS